jgi:Sulfotransferase family
MNRPIVHIGYHKTATTWFQKSFYPTVRNFAYVPRERVKAALLSDTPFSFDPAKAREVLQLDETLPPILCEEELSGYLHNGGLIGYMSAEMAHRIKSVFPDAQIVIFIRSQADMIAATYQQYIRGGGTHSVRRYLFPKRYLHGAAAEPYKIPRFSFAHFEYDRLIAHYDAIFGRENVHVVLYEAFCSDNAGTLAKMQERLGFEAEPGPKAGRRVNRSYGAALIPFARFLNLFTARTVLDKRTLINIPYWYTVRRFILEQLNATGLFGKAPRPERLLGKEVCTYIADYYVQSNRRLAALRDLPLKELGYPL